MRATKPPAPASYGSIVMEPAPPSDAEPRRQTTTVDEEIDAIGSGRFQAIAVAVLSLANASDAVELLCISFVLPRLSAEVFGDTDKALLSSAVFIGMFVGGLVFGVASDVFGRRATLVVSLLINAAFGALSAIVPERPAGALVAMRVLGGFGVGGSIPGVFSMAAELLPTSGRGFYITLVAWGWMFGALYTAAAAWGMIGVLGMGWRPFAAVCALPAFAAALLVALVLPESPRYLMQAGDAHAAERALVAIARWNGGTSRLAKGFRLVPEGESQSKAGSSSAAAASGGAIAASSSASASGAESAHFGIGSSDDDDEGGPPRSGVTLELGSSKKAAPAPREAYAAEQGADSEGAGLIAGDALAQRSWQRLERAYAQALQPLGEFFAPSLLRTSLLLMIVWFALSLGWYGLTLWIPTIFAESDIELDEFQDAFLVQAANLPGNVISSLLVDRVGRKGVLAWSLVFACAAAVAFPFARTEWTVVLCACLLNAASTCSWNALDCLSTESFPTSLRATSMGLLAATGRLGSVVGQFIFGALIHVSLFALLGVAGAVLLLGALAGALLPKEPKGEKLAESLEKS